MEYTIKHAIEDARRMRAQPEYLMDGAQMRRLADTLLSALEANPCYLKALMRGAESFTLVQWDRAAVLTLMDWASFARAHGAPASKTEPVLRMSERWAKQDPSTTKWPD